LNGGTDGVKGGRARASVLSADERKAIARKAVQARWAKVKGLPTLLDQAEQVSEQSDQHAETTAQPMQAGLADHVWSIEKLCSLLPEAESSAKRIDKGLILKALGGL
jgi:poly(3-hydroxybutyrate) depolymerase